MLNHKKELRTLRHTQSQRIRKSPRTAAVAITVREGISYADILRKAKTEIFLSEIGINSSRIRKGVNGGLIIEIPGEGNVEKAKTLAHKLKEIMPEVKVTRATVKADIRIAGLDDSTTKDEVQIIVAEKGDCTLDDVKISEIRWMPNGLGTVWLQCPLGAANRIIEKENGKLKIGWTVARAVVLTPKPLQCYRCWDFGHVRFSCTSKIDRTGHCYRRGSNMHKISQCQEREPKCILCAESGRKDDHRLGSRFCSVDRNSPRGRPLPRIRKEVGIRKGKQGEEEIGIKDVPDRRTTAENMDTDEAVEL